MRKIQRSAHLVERCWTTLAELEKNTGVSVNRLITAGTILVADADEQKRKKAIQEATEWELENKKLS